jgi:hypothetical protein
VKLTELDQSDGPRATALQFAAWTMVMARKTNAQRSDSARLGAPDRSHAVPLIVAHSPDPRPHILPADFRPPIA